MKTYIKSLIILFFIAGPSFVSNSFAVGMGGMGMGMGVPCGGSFPPCPVPLDSSILLLLIAGALLGGKKLYDSLKKNPA